MTVTATLDPALRPTGFNPFTHIKMWLQVIGPDNHTYQIPVVCSSYQAENESDPPTATATYPVHFFPVELGLHSYSIVWSAPNTAGLTFGIPSHFSPPGKTFTAVPSANLGPWRTQGETQEPYEYPFAPHLLDGMGNRHYKYPLTAAWYNIINPDSGVVSKRVDLLDFMVAKKMNRIRVALSLVGTPSQTNHYFYNSGGLVPGGQYCHTIWARINPAGNFLAGNMDFERFDLAQWSLIDAFLAECAARDIHASMILMMPSTVSYASEIFGATNTSATWPPPSAPLITDAASAFPNRWELYYWYLIGRLCTYTHVHYCPMLEYHLMGPGPFSNSNTDGFSHNFASGAATAFVSMEPYLNRDGNSRLISVQGQRGSFYSRPILPSSGSGPPGAAAFVGCPADPERVGYEGDLYSSRLSQKLFPFLDPAQHPFRNYVALHRGGETGLASIVQMLDYAASHNPFIPTAGPGHRQLLENIYSAPCPIFVEEDWVAREDGTRKISPSNHNEDNPYRWEMLNGLGFCRPNPFRFDFLEYPADVHPAVENQLILSDFVTGNADPAKVAIAVGNINGVQKFYRDYAWMTGVICQAYPCWFGPFYVDPILFDYVPPLSALETPNSLASSGTWAQNNRWWTLRYDAAIIVTQAPPIALVGPTNDFLLRRFPHELQAIGAYRDEPGANQYLIYSPYGAFSATQSPVPAILTLYLPRVGPNQSFSYRFHDPDNYSPDAALQIATTNASSQVALTPGVLDPTGPYGEFVLEINP